MKRKIIYFVAAFMTFIVGLALVSLLNYRPGAPKEVTVSDPVKPVSFVNSVADDEPRETSTIPPKHLAAIEIVRFDPEVEINETRIESLSEDSLDFDLDLSHSIENQIIALY